MCTENIAALSLFHGFQLLWFTLDITLWKVEDTAVISFKVDDGTHLEVDTQTVYNRLQATLSELLICLWDNFNDQHLHLRTAPIILNH